MLSCWVFTFLLIPALLAVWERIAPVKRASTADAASPTVPRLLERTFSRPRVILLAFAALTVAAGLLFLWRLPTAIERNLDNLGNELRGQETLLRDHDRAGAALGKSISGAIALLGSREEADAFCDAVRARLSNPRYQEVIEGCATVSSVVPRDQEAKLTLVRDIGRRMSDAVLERLPAEQRQRAETVRQQLAAQRILTLEQAPSSLLDRFRERDGTVGRLAVVTARPHAYLERAPRLEAFVAGVRNVPVGSRTVDASGENVIFSDLLQDIDREGPLTTFLSLAGVCLLVALFLRNGRTSAEVIATLVCGVVLMGGIAALVGLRITFLNFIVYPITFGIAVDYGANVVLRSQERGGRVLQALVEVGPAVILCSWTTIIGYGSLVIASNRALRSFGWYALLGEGACLLTALVMLPAFLLVAERSPVPGRRLR
jgi:predicted RND superfamily exporter protein